MKKYLYALFTFMLVLAYINPVHYSPWPAMWSIFLAIFSALFLVPLLTQKKIAIPKFSLVIVLLASIVWMQYALGVVFYLNTAIIVSSILFLFFMIFVVGYNLEKIDRGRLLFILCRVFSISASISSVLAILQWVGLDDNPYLISSLVGNRPYANINQFNQLSTLLLLGVFSNFYFYEKKIIKNSFLIFLTCLFAFAIALTQSRTAWVSLFFVLIYFINFSKKLSFNFTKKKLISGLMLFVALIFILPFINVTLSKYLNVVYTSSVLDRVSSGYLRVNIWSQMLSALYDRPIQGYGWFQTSAAQFNVIDRVHGVEWASSAHNLFLDLLVWNGILIGSLIIIYICVYFIRPILQVQSKDSWIAATMVAIIGVHAMLEYPIFYTFFNLPLALLLGIIWSERQVKEYFVRSVYIKILAVFVVGFSIVFIRQYNNIQWNIITANLYENHQIKTIKYELAYPTPLFDDFEQRAKWFAFSPYQYVTVQQLDDIQKVVSLNLTSYDLRKYAILLYYNGQDIDAKRILMINYVMYQHPIDEIGIKKLISDIKAENLAKKKPLNSKVKQT